MATPLRKISRGDLAIGAARNPDREGRGSREDVDDRQGDRRTQSRARERTQAGQEGKRPKDRSGEDPKFAPVDKSDAAAKSDRYRDYRDTAGPIRAGREDLGGQRPYAYPEEPKLLTVRCATGRRGRGTRHPKDRPRHRRDERVL